jgi:hypothetical protein
MKRKYKCLHCRKEWDEPYLADLCFKIDSENLQKYGETDVEKENKPSTIFTRNKKYLKSKQKSK